MCNYHEKVYNVSPTLDQIAGEERESRIAEKHVGYSIELICSKFVNGDMSPEELIERAIMDLWVCRDCYWEDAEALRDTRNTNQRN